MFGPQETGRKTIKLNALPTLNLPQKSHEPERRVIVKHIQNETYDTVMPIYQNFQELCCHLQNLKLKEWTFSKSENTVKLNLYTTELRIPKFEIFLNESIQLIKQNTTNREKQCYPIQRC